MGMHTSTYEPESHLDPWLEEAQQTLRFSSSTLLRAMTAASRRCDAGHLRLLFEDLSVRHAVLHTMLAERMSDRDLAPSAATLATFGWLAARGCLPDDGDDDAVVRRCHELAHDLLLRCEELEDALPASGFATVLHGFTDAMRVLRDRIGAQERRQ